MSININGRYAIASMNFEPDLTASGLN